MVLSSILAEALGRYFGVGDGKDSGAFVARIEIGSLPNGGVSLSYEATSREQGLQHQEHSLLCAGPDGRDRLFIAHSESPFVTEMMDTGDSSGRFVQAAPAGPYTMEVVIETPEVGRLTYAWWWAEAGEQPVEQSKADVRLMAGGMG